jgi:hypothetical protein
MSIKQIASPRIVHVGIASELTIQAAGQVRTDLKKADAT